MIIRFIFLLLLISGSIQEGFAQYDKVWAFGSRSGLDFNPANPVPIRTSILNTEGCASICNEDGQLLFYTEGSFIWDRENNLMPNGELLNELFDYPGSFLSSATYSSMQGTVIVPYPDHDDWYYVFSLTHNELFVTGNNGRLYYSIVDMSLNGGMGDVVPGEKGIFVDSLFGEYMSAVVGERCNAWLIVPSYPLPECKAYEITASGLNLTPVISPLSGASIYGELVGSKSRKKIAFGKLGLSGVDLYDFDGVSGLLSNPLSLAIQQPSFGSVAFSPDDSKLYYSSENNLFQLDITSGDSAVIAASAVTLGAFDPFRSLRLGPDGKIYFSSPTVLNTLGVINYPNEPGLACMYDPAVIEVLSGTHVGRRLPNSVAVIPHDTFYTQQPVSAACFASHALLTALDSTGWDYVWSTGTTNSSEEVSEPGTYWVSYRTAPCNFHTDTFHVGFANGVLPSIRIDTACAGSSNGNAYAGTYPGDTVQYAYTWLSGDDTLSVSPALESVPMGNYTLVVQTAHCDTSLQVFIPEADYRVSFTVSDTVLCLGDTLYVQNLSPAQFDQFGWYFGDGDSSQLATPTGHVYQHPGTYELVMTGSGPVCGDTASMMLVVDAAFVPLFDMDQPQVCVGDRVTFRLGEADHSFTGLHWDWGDGSYLDTWYETRFVHAFDAAGTWPVTGTLITRACPDASFTDTVHVYALPEVDLGADTSLCLDGSGVVLRNFAAVPAAPYAYLWNTGDTAAHIRVLQPGTYSLQVSTEPLHCTTVDEIVVSRDCYIDVPNAFTPNGDGDNDYFFPRTLLSRGLSDFRMQVFDRWGQLVFETRAKEGRGWDGRFNDRDQPVGVYVYLIDVDYVNKRREQYKGTVTLIR